jgi:birA, biotin-[acetyl-CoA-carboxylase] ligase region
MERKRFIHLRETDSTNKALKEISDNEDIPSGSIVIADFQTAGRGQTGNSWESEAGKNLTFSVFFRPVNMPANKIFTISEMVSLSVKYTLDKYFSDITVKWPNDIYHKDRKIAGILIENTFHRREISQSIIGIGINVNQEEFRSNAPNPVSMIQIAGHPFDIMAVLDDFRRIFDEQSKRCLDAIHSDYLNSIYRKDGYHRYCDDKGVFEAAIHGIDHMGYLTLRRKDNTLSRYAFKGVVYEINNPRLRGNKI